MKKKCILYGTNYNMNDLIINKIIDDPEKFIDMPF